MNIFQDIIKAIEGIPSGIVKLFTSPQAEAAIKEAATLSIDAAPYVQELLPLFNNPTATAVANAYAKYAVPLAENIETATPAQLMTYTNNLVVTLLQKNKAPATAVTVLETAVSLAKTVVVTPAPATT